MSKAVQIREGVEFTLRMDAINLLNKPQWGDPNTDVFSVNFGRITNAGGAQHWTSNKIIIYECTTK
jgi:hypothetical protein